jgi:hypothetical protein
MRKRNKRNELRSRAAVDALRFGVVNPFAAENITCGRQKELEGLEGAIEDSPNGSVQNIIGGYGAGKSHLCELLASRLEKKGYAVAKVEMGSSHGRAENPDSFLSNISRNIRASVNGEPCIGAAEMAARVYPERNCRPGLFESVPSAMTAANLAVARINRAAHSLEEIGIKGIVVLLDEAERSNFAWNAYRQQRAWSLMVGLSLAAVNGDTSGLKHYHNNPWYPYCPVSPSRIHVVNCFTFPWGIANAISTETGCRTMELDQLNDGVLEKVAAKVIRLYQRAYGSSNELNGALWLKIWERFDDEIRGFIRCIVAALDNQRLAGNA